MIHSEVSTGLNVRDRHVKASVSQRGLIRPSANLSTTACTARSKLTMFKSAIAPSSASLGFPGHLLTRMPVLVNAIREQPSNKDAKGPAREYFAPPTVAQTKRRLLEKFRKPLQGIYNEVLEDLLVQMHFIRYRRDYSYNELSALGLVSLFELIFDPIDEADRRRAFDAFVSALGEEPAIYRADAAWVESAAAAVSSVDDLVPDLSGSAIQRLLGRIIGRSAKNGGETTTSTMKNFITTTGHSSSLASSPPSPISLASSEFSSASCSSSTSPSSSSLPPSSSSPDSSLSDSPSLPLLRSSSYKYNKLWAVGLFRILDSAGTMSPVALRQLSEALGISPERVANDLRSCRDVLTRLSHTAATDAA